MGYNPAIDRDYATQPATGAIRYLERQNPARFVSTEEIPINVIPMRFGLYEARGYDLPIMRRFDRLWRSEVTPTGGSVAAGLVDIPLRFPAPTPSALRVHAAARGDAHPAREDRALPDRRRWTGWCRSRRCTPAVCGLCMTGLMRVCIGWSGALPRAFVVRAQRVVSGGDAALAAVTDPGFDGRAGGCD